jgi:hypothetical protein
MHEPQILATDMAVRSVKPQIPIGWNCAATEWPRIALFLDSFYLEVIVIRA